jgi:hypothetical protein
MKKPTANEPNAEIAAIAAVYKALEGLTPEAQSRVLGYVARMLDIKFSPAEEDETTSTRPPDLSSVTGSSVPTGKMSQPEVSATGEDGLEGISPVARKWMTRNALHPKALSAIFSLGVDEIDLVAKEVPGKSKKDKMHSVFLLKGVAAYLGGGVARFTHEQVKEACLHYGAYDSGNFATHLRSFAGDVSGDATGGYALTTRGLASATEMVKGMSGPK